MQICISSSIVNTLCRMQFLLVFVAFYVGAVHSWDLAATPGDDTIYFLTDFVLTMTLRIPFRNISALTYNENHNMMLYVDKQTNGDSICGYNITYGENKCFTQGSGRDILDLAFDPVTERVFFTDSKSRSVNWISLKRGSNNNVNLLLKKDAGTPYDIVVDSCDGYIYWTNSNLTKPTIERARLNGNEREVFENLTTVNNTATLKFESSGLAIDQPMRRLLWVEPKPTSEGSTYNYELYGRALNNTHKPKLTLVFLNKYFKKTFKVTVSKDFIFHFVYKNGTFQLYSKNVKILKARTIYSDKSMTDLTSVVAKYEIKDQIHGCEALASVEIVKEYDGPFCVNGTKVNDKSTCKCALGYTGERCDVSVCENHCLHGTCSFDVKGFPKCSCAKGYSGERCSSWVCENFCIRGNCNVNETGHPVCRCAKGYNGERCSREVCETFCVHGNCSVNEKGIPVCRCAKGYTGERCSRELCETFCVHGNCSVNEKDIPSCRCAKGYNGERCSFSTCENFCLRGNCSINEKGLPVCRCGPGYSGVKCHISACENYCLHGDCCAKTDGFPVCRCNYGFTGKRCEIDACEGYCANNGRCSLTVDNNPSCQCATGYRGDRCETVM